MLEIIDKAIQAGAKLYSSVSGGKDGQAMTSYLHGQGYHVHELIHADLGRVEWPQSMEMCEALSRQFNVPLVVVKRHDGLDMLAYWQRRLTMLMYSGKPFWSSSKARYCTSDLKREPINKHFRNCGENFIISCEGIRAQESRARAEKDPLTIRWEITSTFYKGMTVEQAIENYNPAKRLALSWYPIFEFSLDQVWDEYNMAGLLWQAQEIYNTTGKVPEWWAFHPAYVYGNERVSCMICVLGSDADIRNGGKHNPELADEMLRMEVRGSATFKNGKSLYDILSHE